MWPSLAGVVAAAAAAATDAAAAATAASAVENEHAADASMSSRDRGGRARKPLAPRRVAAGELSAAYREWIANALIVRDVPATCSRAELVAEITLQRERAVASRLTQEVEQKREVRSFNFRFEHITEYSSTLML